jgi:hypothetical protein
MAGSMEVDGQQPREATSRADRLQLALTRLDPAAEQALANEALAAEVPWPDFLSESVS